MLSRFTCHVGWRSFTTKSMLCWNRFFSVRALIAGACGGKVTADWASSSLSSPHTGVDGTLMAFIGCIGNGGTSAGAAKPPLLYAYALMGWIGLVFGTIVSAYGFRSTLLLLLMLLAFSIGVGTAGSSPISKWISPERVSLKNRENNQKISF